MTDISVQATAKDTSLWVPSDQGFKAWSADPINAIQSLTPVAGGPVLYTKMKVLEPFALSKINLIVAQASTAENANCFFGVHKLNAAGNEFERLGVSADQSVALRAGGEKEIAIVVDGGKSLNINFPYFWVSTLIGTQGVTPAALRSFSGSSTVTNFGVAAGSVNARVQAAGAGLTAIPAAVALGALALGSGPILLGAK